MVFWYGQQRHCFIMLIADKGQVKSIKQIWFDSGLSNWKELMRGTGCFQVSLKVHDDFIKVNHRFNFKHRRYQGDK